MYAEWPSIEKEILGKCRSVLHTYPSSVGKEVAKSVVGSLFSNNPSKFRVTMFSNYPSTLSITDQAT